MRIGSRIVGLFAASSLCLAVLAQPKQEELKKPKEFQERQLGSEKMANKKFTPVRHFFQNMYTHYNYYFNAKHKLLDIIEIAKTQTKEDYTKLLPFYSYSLDATAKNTDVDTVIQKCTAGILLHDLRNDWVDNLYVLIGRSYLLKKQYDSAAMTFQYVNYAFSPKEKDGYDKVIGSNSNEGGNALSIATKEKNNIYKKIIELPPSRNESFLWLIRTSTEREEFIDAASLITTLRNDPVFPKRLKEEIAEVESYNYYKQGIYDSSAKYLLQAVSLAENNTEKARWYYLLGQMYQETGNLKDAATYYAKSASTTIDPVMEVYARLASVRLRKNDDPKIVEENIQEIVKMARKEKYEFYRDIIYYAAALSEIERKGYTKADEYLAKSIKFNAENPEQRSKSFLLWADMSFDTKQYGKAGNLYDSVNTSVLDSSLLPRIEARKPGCKTVYEKDRIIYAQDSLLRIAALPENERNSFVKALGKKLRKERGIKEVVDSSNTGLSVGVNTIGKGATNLFGDSKEFYFYNPSLKSNGYQTFKQKWGARPNVDNWRRSASLQSGAGSKLAGITPKTDLSSASTATDLLDVKDVGADGVGAKPIDLESIYNPSDLSFDALSSNLPVEKAQVAAANESINKAMLEKGRALQNQIEDLPEAIKVYEALLARLGKDTGSQEVIFNLIYCYNKTGEKAKADELKKRLNAEYKDGIYTKKMNEPAAGTEKSNPSATAKYKEIYNLFIEGNFEKAVAEKKIADSLYSNNFWTPQLLYIESVYYIKQREDSTAVNKLQAIVSKYGATPLGARAKTMIDVLGRRKEIEDHLNKLNITRYPSDTTVNTLSASPLLKAPEPTKTGTVVTNNPPVVNTPAVIPPATIATTTTPKKDSVTKAPIVKTANVSKKDSLSKSVGSSVKGGTTAKKDSLAKLLVPKPMLGIDTATPQMVGIVMDRVDIVYINESVNAFNRYNSQAFSGQTLEITKQKIDNRYSLLTIKSPDFTTASKAMAYIAAVKPKTNTNIVPWLDASKFSFIIIDQTNYDLLKQNLDMQGYLNKLKAAMPGKF